jgi:hypothetical protein
VSGNHGRSEKDDGMLRGFLTAKRFAADTDLTPATGATPITEPATGAVTPPNGDVAFTQADVDRIVEQRLSRAKTKAEADAAKVKADAEQRALTEQGEWKTLAEQRAARLAELEPLTKQVETAKEEADRYRKAIAKYADDAKKAVPEHVRALLDKLDPIDQLDWLATNAAALTQATAVGTPRTALGTNKPVLPAAAEPPRRVVKL